MTSISTGVDLVEIDRFEKLNPKIKERFYERVFTSAEVKECGQCVERFAGKFAAKEAASKALGCGIGKVSWQELEILDDLDGRPQLLFHGSAGKAAKAAGWHSWSLSITHTRTHAMAVVNALFDESAAG